MTQRCKCEHWQFCPVCAPQMFDGNGNRLPPEPTPLEAAKSEIERLRAANERLREAIAEHPLSPIHGYAADIAALLDRLDAAERELERERMRLVACGVVAGANTPESAANARQMHPDHLSGSCDAVACAVDREMALRAENERLVAKIGELVDACALLRVENSKSEREALCWQELDRFISTCDPANAAAWKRLRKRIDEDIGRAIDAARAAEKGKE